MTILGWLIALIVAFLLAEYSVENIEPQFEEEAEVHQPEELVENVPVNNR